jgi:isopentenyl diphosphate isomerase/L-lactate dehydrogenase-like FMN-dependent dehydrogenase
MAGYLIQLFRRAVFSNAWGVEGVEKFFTILQGELVTHMQLIGVQQLSQVNATHVSYSCLSFV